MAAPAARAVAVVARLAASRPGRRALGILTLTRLRAARLRGDGLGGALETVRRARFLADRHHPAEARDLLAAGARILGDGDEVGVLGVEDAVTALDAGLDRGPWLGALRRLLRLADGAWLAGHDDAVEELLDMALRLVFHPEIQFGDAGGPRDAAADQDSLEPLRVLQASTAWRAVTADGAPQDPVAGHAAAAATPATETSADGAPQGPVAEHAATAATAAPARTTPPAPEAGAPRRVVFLALRNLTFLRGIIADYEADERTDVDVIDLAEPGTLPALPTRRAMLAARIRAARGGAGVGVPGDLAARLARADTVFVEWGAGASTWASLVVPAVAPRARLIVRLHSYEASTAWPHLTRWSAVDTLVTVAPPIRALLEATVAGLAPAHPNPTAASPARPATAVVTSRPSTTAQPAGLARPVTAVVTLPNRNELRRFVLPKHASASRTLALVGWAARRKDPAWALDVLDLLRETDPAWRLLLIGPPFPEHPASEADAAYADALANRLARLGGGVTITGRTDRVPEHLRGAGVILSASRREGTHEGFIEGVASGALAVCRSWPDVARWGGPSALFPAEWVVETPEQAAERILGHADDAAERAASQDLVLERFDWTRVRPAYDRLLLGGSASA